jgi:hypothetical protein
MVRIAEVVQGARRKGERKRVMRGRITELLSEIKS